MISGPDCTPRRSDWMLACVRLKLLDCDLDSELFSLVASRKFYR